LEGIEHSSAYRITVYRDWKIYAKYLVASKQGRFPSVRRSFPSWVTKITIVIVWTVLPYCTYRQTSTESVQESN